MKLARRKKYMKLWITLKSGVTVLCECTEWKMDYSAGDVVAWSIKGMRPNRRQIQFINPKEIVMVAEYQ